MICERCQKKKASVIHRSMRGGRMQVRYACAACSEILEATRELEDISAALPPYTASMIGEDGGCFPFFLPTADATSDRQSPSASAEETAGTTTCPLCGMTEAELLAEGRAGCPACYAAFGALIREAAAVLHTPVSHAGHLPRAVRERRETARRLAALREELLGAVTAEAYERAAALRDEIRGLECGAVAANT